MTSLLALTNDEEAVDGFREEFETVTHGSLADARITTGEVPDVRIDGTPVEEFDAVYLNPDPKASIYGRVFLESIQEKQVTANISPSAFTILAKKHYLFKVLNERDVPIPPTMAISTAKGLAEADETIDFPAVASLFDGFERAGAQIVDGLEGLEAVAERAEHGSNVVIVQEIGEGDLFETLYIGGDMISIKIEGGRPEITEDTDITRNYQKLSDEQQAIVEDTATSIGADVCRIRMEGETVVDVNSDPDLERFERLSGKDAYGKIAEVLEADEG